MIKLIATDMGETLLDDNNNLPKEFFKTLNSLTKKDIKFVVASGRPYFTLYENFKPYSDKLYYLCDNGAYIVNEKKETTINVIEKTSVQAILGNAINLNNCEIIL